MYNLLQPFKNVMIQVHIFFIAALQFSLPSKISNLASLRYLQ